MLIIPQATNTISSALGKNPEGATFIHQITWNKENWLEGSYLPDLISSVVSSTTRSLCLFRMARIPKTKTWMPQKRSRPAVLFCPREWLIIFGISQTAYSGSIQVNHVRQSYWSWVSPGSRNNTELIGGEVVGVFSLFEGRNDRELSCSGSRFDFFATLLTTFSSVADSTTWFTQAKLSV